MPLPKRPSGGATPKNVAPPKFSKSEADESIESELSLPELDDFTLPNLSYDEDFDSDSSNEYSPAPTATPDSLSVTDYAPKSINHFKPEPSKSAVSDELDAFEDEDEETRLNRELGLLDDDFAPVRSSIETRNEEQNDDQSDFEYGKQISTTDTPTDDSFDSALIELDENPLAEEPEDDEFADLLKDLEEIANSDDEPEASQDEDDQESETDSEETDWESALAELEANSEEYSLPMMPVDSVDNDTDEDDDDEEDDLTSYVREMQDFVPPSNPFAIPENFVDPEEPEGEDDDENESEQDEEEFIPPSDPFANPFADDEPQEDQILTDEDEEENERDSSSRKPKETGLKDKVAAYPAKAKKGLKNYFAKINAELHGEELPKSQEDEDEPFDKQNQDEMDQGRPERGSNRSGLAIFGFLRPIKSLYTGIVNFIFGILTTVLGILAKLPLIGFVFKIALEATKVLRAIAQYIPLAFFIGGLILTSYLSVARESIIALPDSGGATFNDFNYDSVSNSASGVILNTGNIIADVQPTFEIKSIKPGANPISWVIPETVATCEVETVQVDIDDTMNVTAKCSEPITGFFPRATGELK